MIKYELIPHMADIRLKIEGSTQSNLLKSALQGMAILIKKDFKNYAPTLNEKITIQSPDQTSLLIDFLSEILTKNYTLHAVFYKIEFIQLSHTNLCAIIKGVKIQQFDKDIKAVTYHEANVLKNKLGNLETIIVFDI